MWIRLHEDSLDVLYTKVFGDPPNNNLSPIATFETRDALLKDSEQGNTEPFVAIDLTTGNVFRFVNQLTLRKV